MDPKNPDFDRDVIRVVVDKLATRNSRITYGNIAEIIGANRGMKLSPESLAWPLGRIQKYCLELGLPSLPVMVYDVKGKVGDGFIPEYKRLHPEAASLSDKEIIEMEREACLACKDWQRLYDYAGINETAPVTVDRLAIMQGERAFEEGARITKELVKETQRSAEARTACLAAKGYRCIVCEQDLEDIYGVPGIIHVHHLNPLADGDEQRTTDPIKDLVPVCPNCHAVIHSKKGGHGRESVYTPNEVREMLGFAPLETYE